MLLVADVAGRQRRAADRTAERPLRGIDQLNVPRSDDPGRHARRLLGARPDGRPRRATRVYYRLLAALRARGPAARSIINTSFNVRGEPIVCTPEDAYRCFMRTDMDVLVLENFVLLKTEQPAGLAGDRDEPTSAVSFELD